MTEQTTPSAAERTPEEQAVRRFGIVGVAIPAILTLAALAAQFQWFQDAPDPLATHWSGATPDAHGSRWVYPLLTVLLGFGLPAWLWATALPRMRRGSRGWSFRFLAAMALGLAAFSAVAMSGSVYVQRGIDSWQDAPSILPVILVASLLGIAAGFIGWFAQPQQHLEFNSTPTAAVQLAEGERAVWVGVAKAGRALVAVMILAVVLIAAGAVSCWFAGEFGLMWLMLGLAVLLAVVAMATFEADVRVDAAGVEVRGPAGWPRSRTALAEVESATAITVEGIGAFGGFGWRRVPGAVGVILRSGEALRVQRKDRPDLVVTVDDAATAAGLLEALKSRSDAAAEPGVDQD